MMVNMRRLARLSMLLSAAALAGAGACGPSGGGATCDGLVAGALVISEVQADYDAPAGASGADTGHEWFEIYNPSSAPIELAGVLVEHLRPTETITDDAHTMGTITIPAGGYLVLGNVVPETAPAHVDYGYGADLGDLFNTGSGKLRLSCGGTVIDEAIYDNVEAGRTRTLDGSQAPDYQTNDLPAAWCAAGDGAEFEYEPANFGTPGAPNQDCMNVTPGQCDDGGTMRPTVPPVVGDVVITEVMPDPNAVGDAVGEWIEVRVNRDIDVNDLAIAGASGTPITVTSSSCLRVTAGSHLVFARVADTAMNGGLPTVTGQTVSLSNDPGTVRVLLGATELDAMTWTTSPTGRSIQLSAGLTAPADNEVATNLCEGNAPYGAGDLGSPGMANRDCGATTAGMCTDAGTGALRPIVTPTAGQLVISEWMPDPVIATDANGEWFELQATADVDLNGLQAGATSLGATPIVPASGPCVRLATGTRAMFAHTTDATNGLPAGTPIAGTFTFGLSANNAGSFQIGFGGANLATATWATNASTTSVGSSWQVSPTGTICTAVAAGAAPYATAVGPTRSDVGTPGAANPNCP